MNIISHSRSSSPRDTSPTFVDLGGINCRSLTSYQRTPAPPLVTRELRVPLSASLSALPLDVADAAAPGALPPPKFFERVIGARVHLGPIGTGSAVWRLRVAAAEEQATDTEDESTESEPSCDSPVRPKATRF